MNGVLVDGNRPITLARNVPVVATPRSVGLPSACNGATHLSVKTVVTSGLPNGVVIDAKTGVLSGTPTALGWYNLEMKLTIDGHLQKRAADGRLHHVGPAPLGITRPARVCRHQSP